MAKQQKPRMQRQIQAGGLAAMERLEQRSDEELEAETKFKAAAYAILGARAAERYDARATRGYYQRALAAARPQERMQLRRMADASIALAERRAGDLKEAVTRLGQTPPSDRQLFMLRLMGLLAPPPGSSLLVRMRGVGIVLGLIVALLLIGLGLAELIALPFGGVSLIGGLLLGLVIVAAILGVLALVGRRRQARARAAALAARR
ncbi:MAG TPA: hypothetical protein VFS37_03420 [Conexibacter sp.]|nr:hypothetical protein [Conexibacter sp.]